MYLLRYERAELIADESVENSSRLLSVNKVHIDIFGACYALFDRVFVYLIKFNSVLFIKRQPENRGKMPGNSLSLSVGVGCEQNLICICGFFL